MTPIRSPRQSGVGLIEVLIAVLILGIGMLGIAALQTMTLRNVGASADRTQAVIQTYAVLDTLRAQRAAALAGSFNTDGFQCSTATALGTPGTLTGWLADVRQTVAPSACGQVTCVAATCTIKVRWSEERATGQSATPQMVTTVSAL